MPETLIVLLAFIIALAIGIFIGKSVFSSKTESERKVLEERNNSLALHAEQLKQQAANDRQIAEKQLNQVKEERDNLRGVKDSLALQLTKKETDYDNLTIRINEQRKETDELREKFTKEFENWQTKFWKRNRTSLLSKTVRI